MAAVFGAFCMTQGQGSPGETGMPAGVAGLIAETHGRCFRLICDVTDEDCEGLTYAARVARRRHLINDKVFK